MLNIDPIVQIDVRVGTSTASVGVFDVGAILGSTPVSGYFDMSNRYKEYTSLAAMVADGFQTTSDEYKAAAKYFGVDPAPSKVVMIYYFANPAAADAAVEYDSAHTYNVGDYCKHTESTVTKLYCCKTNSTTGAWDSSKWDEVTTVNESPAEAMLDAIDRGAEFYAAYYIPKADETTSNINRYIAGIASAFDSQNRGVVFYGFAGTVADAIDDSGIFATMQAASAASKVGRAVGLYCTSSIDDAAGLMGAAMGLSRVNRNSAFALCYKSVASATANNLTQTEVESIKEVNGNVYVQRTRARAFVENGATSNGMRFDETLYVDRMTFEIQQAIYELIANSATKLPQVDSTSAIFINEIHDILDGYYNIGVLETNQWRGASIDGMIEKGDFVEHGHAEFVDSFDIQTEEDRIAHKAMPITVLLCLSGSVESISITVDVQT